MVMVMDLVVVVADVVVEPVQHLVPGPLLGDNGTNGVGHMVVICSMTV
jgi:hypothetical protein